MTTPADTSGYVLDFSQISLDDVSRVGGKNASLGELFRALQPKGVGVVDGFATTADAYRRLLATNGLEERLRSIFGTFDSENLVELSKRGQAARTAVLETPLPEDVTTSILGAYDRLCDRFGREPEMAVRSSATAEDLPEASFASTR
jgi:pyruvate,water dikinase